MATKKRICINRSAFAPPKPKRHRHAQMHLDPEVAGFASCVDTPTLQRKVQFGAGRLKELASADQMEAGKTYYYEEIDSQMMDIQEELRKLRGEVNTLKADVFTLRSQSADKELRFLFKAVMSAISGRLNLSYVDLVASCKSRSWVNDVASQRLQATFNNGTTFFITRPILHAIPQVFTEYTVLSSEYIHRSSVRAIAFALVHLNETKPPLEGKVTLANEIFKICFSVDPSQLVQQAIAGTIVQEFESVMLDG